MLTPNAGSRKIRAPFCEAALPVFPSLRAGPEGPLCGCGND